ncbi:chaplin [Actinomadura madurae]|uniref:chaplin n=1 Tax=Actinomadura madurae TaxID=1993 RepID=UPI0020D20921|nr:chaplin [Actinomadura madurae]MCP9952715.1 chaplin [Actinomadura madurae]MCP9969480.1 chaplin [Actinomadura madurae]MCP9981935.1 chaplin [Actinomadura madurae]
MRTWAKGTSRAAVLTAGFVALGVSAIPANAFADVTNGGAGVLSGNQVDVPVSAPVDVSGNGAALLGTTHATSRGGVKVRKRGGDGRTSGAHGIASGNQVNAPISLPVNVCGNGAAVLGEADAGCRGGASAGGGGAGGGQRTDGTGGVLAGNQVHAPISIPVNVCGNAVAVAGEAVGGCEGGARVKTGGDTGSGQQTSGIVGVGAGNQADVPISVPVDICGNAVGNAAAACEGGASVRNGGHRTGRQTTAGDLGVIAGNQGNAPVSIPLTVCGNAAAVAGQAAAFCEGGAHARSSSGGDQRTSGVGGVLAGNQGNTPVTAPAEVCGNAAAVVGLAGASCNGQTLVEGSQGSGAQTSGGNQANAPVKAPADACGNAAAIVGLASGLCQDGPGSGGYQPYSRTTGTVPATGALPSENTLPKADGVRGLTKLVAVPTVDTPRLPAGHQFKGTKNLTAARHGGTTLPKPRPATASAGEGLDTVRAEPLAVSLLDTQALPGGTGLPKLNARHAHPLPGTDGLAELNAHPAIVGHSQVTDRHTADDLPTLPGIESLSAERRGAGALPGLSVLPVGGESLSVERREGGALPGVSGLPNAGGLVALPKADGLSGVRVLPVGGKALSAERRGVGGLTPVSALARVDGLPSLFAVPRTDALVQDDGQKNLVADGALGETVDGVRAQVPGGGAAGRSLAAAGSNARSHGAPRLPLRPLQGGRVLPATPVSADGMLRPGGQVPVTSEIGPVAEVAAKGAAPSGKDSGSVWVLAVSGVLAFAAGTLALARRLRVGRR